jgi:hypothetical protein
MKIHTVQYTVTSFGVSEHCTDSKGSCLQKKRRMENYWSWQGLIHIDFLDYLDY